LSKREKLISKWRQSLPTEEEFESVRSLLEHFGFTSRFVSSHYVVHHDKLEGNPHFFNGELSIPVKNGRQVKGFYLRSVLEALEYIGVIEE